MDQKQYIIEKSGQLFFKNGFKVVTMDDVAAANGISKRTLYELFKDKKTLLSDCIQSYIITSKKKAMEANADSENTIDMMFRMFYRFQSLYTEKTARREQELKKYYPDVYYNVYMNLRLMRLEEMKKSFKKSIEQGIIDEALVDLKRTPYVFDSLIADFDDSKIVELYNGTRFDAFRDLILIHFRGLTTEKGREIIDGYLKDEKKFK